MTVVDLQYRPREWQKKCHLKRRRFTVLALHRRAGKTTLALMELVQAALKCQLDLGTYFYVAPFLKQAKVIAWAPLKQRLAPLVISGAVEISESELTVRFRHNGAIIRIFGADNPDAMRGVRLDGAVIDEVAQVKPEVWSDILQPALSDRKGFALFIGTPSGINMFSELYYSAEGKDDWYAARYTCYDTEALDPVEIERMRRDMSETTFARELLVDFAAAGDDQLISLADAEDAARRKYTDGDIASSPRILGVDPARFGDDRSVIMPRQGLVCFEPMAYRGIDNMELAARVAAKIDEWAPDAVFIDAGNGSGVIDRLRQLNHNVIEVNFGGKANNPHYTNRRTEMWFETQKWLKAGGSIPADMSLKQELATPKFWYDASNRAVLEPKDEIKKRLQGGGSPDLADALALTFASPVAKASALPIGRQVTRADYNPYAKRRG